MIFKTFAFLNNCVDEKHATLLIGAKVGKNRRTWKMFNNNIWYFNIFSPLSYLVLHFIKSKILVDIYGGSGITPAPYAALHSFIKLLTSLHTTLNGFKQI